MKSRVEVEVQVESAGGTVEVETERQRETGTEEREEHILETQDTGHQTLAGLLAGLYSAGHD